MEKLHFIVLISVTNDHFWHVIHLNFIFVQNKHLNEFIIKKFFIKSVVSEKNVVIKTYF